MAKTPKNSGKNWARTEVAQPRKEAKGNTPTGLIAYDHGRSQAAIRSEASEENISLKPANQSPDNRRKK